MLERLKIRICTRLLGHKGQLLLMSVLQRSDGDFSCASLLSSKNDVLMEACNSTMESHKEIRAFILKIAENYLSRREIDGKNFAERILAK